ncbi:MAG TPA: hypothetical protein VLB84_01250, partial [Bacteroidia bacterium]|nr:hypothetical protein [Bacteroidia bacterium]
FFLFTGNFKAQDIGIGGYLGGGFIGGESPNIGSFNTSLFADFPFINKQFYPRLTFIYAGDFDNILPGTRYDYFPFQRAVSLKGIVTQNYSGNYFLEEGVGFIYMNDRTFSTVNEWNAGIAVSLAAGLKLKNIADGFSAAAGTEYAFGFGGTFPRYFSVHLQIRYLL